MKTICSARRHWKPAPAPAARSPGGQALPDAGSVQASRAIHLFRGKFLLHLPPVLKYSCTAVILRRYFLGVGCVHAAVATVAPEVDAAAVVVRPRRCRSRGGRARSCTVVPLEKGLPFAGASRRASRPASLSCNLSDRQPGRCVTVTFGRAPLRHRAGPRLRAHRFAAPPCCCSQRETGTQSAAAPLRHAEMARLSARD